METQSTPGIGEWKAEAIALLQALPTELPEGFKENSAWYHAQIRELLRVDPHSDLARRLEAILAGGVSQVQHIETNPYANEKVKPAYFYPKGYKPNSVKEQVKRLLAVYDWLNASHVDALAKSWGKYPEADGLYVTPKPTRLAEPEHLNIANHWDNFGLLTEQGPLAALSSQRTFKNYREGQLGPEFYRLADTVREALQKLEAEQPGDLLVFPAQTGKLYAGFSPRNTRWEIERVASPSQWPLPAYCGGWILVANPHRLEKYEHLVIDLPGDEIRLSAGEPFDDCLYFDVDDYGTLYLCGRWVRNARDFAGAGSVLVQ